MYHQWSLLRLWYHITKKIILLLYKHPPVIELLLQSYCNLLFSYIFNYLFELTIAGQLIERAITMDSDGFHLANRRSLEDMRKGFQLEDSFFFCKSGIEVSIH